MMMMAVLCPKEGSLIGLLRLPGMRYGIQ